MDSSKDYNRRVMVREVSTKKNHLISVFNNFEVTFSDKKKKYFDKLQSLPAAWEQICNFVLESPSESPQPQFESLFLHTLKFVLRADWRHASKATKTHLTLTLQRLINELTNTKNHLSILPQCRVLESVINEPWDHPVLKKIFQDEETTTDELIDYFHLENGKVVVARLEMLLESKCEDLAYRLSKSCLMTYNNSHPLELDLNQSEYNYIMDMYLCCSFKIKNTSDLIAEMKTFDLCEGLQLLKRYRLNGGVAGGYNDSCKEARIWKSSKKTIELISTTLLANAVLHDDLDDSDVEYLRELISEWASVHTTNLMEIFAPVPSEVIRKCVLIARCSKCIYPFCSFLIECGGKEKDINQVTSSLIRAINQNMNEIEQYRVNRDRDKLKSAYELLCKGFILISSLFKEYKNIYKECLLTAFSITPSRKYLETLEQFINTESMTETDMVTAKIENNNEITIDDQNETGESVRVVETEIKADSDDIKVNVDAENTGKATLKTEPLDDYSIGDGIRGHGPAYMVEVESLQVEESLKTDLNSILRYQRYHALTWDLEWAELKSNCEKYLEIFEKRGFDEVELKYLELDYEQFKNKPSLYEDIGGIEKGYEHYVLYSSDEDLRAVDKSSLTSDETDFDDVDYGRRKRKKQKAKKKRLPPKPKVEYSETDDLEFQDYVNEQQDSRDARSKKRRRKRIDECDLDLKRKRGRPRKTQETNEETSDANIDSQSENQPPPNNEDILASTKSSPNDLQMLRQFRINASQTLKEETTDDSAKSEKNGKDAYVNGNRMQQLKICIPKCDAMTSVNGCVMLKETSSELTKRKAMSGEEDSEKSDRGEDETAVEEIERPPRRPKPQMSATLLIPARRFSSDKLGKRDRFGRPKPVSKYMLKKLKTQSVARVGHHAAESLDTLNDTMSDIFGDLLKDSEIQAPAETSTVAGNISMSAPVMTSSGVAFAPAIANRKQSYLVPSSEETEPLPPALKAAVSELKTSLSIRLSPLTSADYALVRNSSIVAKPTTTALPSFAKISPSKSSYNEPPVQPSPHVRVPVTSYLTTSIGRSYPSSSKDPRIKSQSSIGSPSVTTSSSLPSQSLYPVVRIPNICCAVTSTGSFTAQYSSASSQPSSVQVTYSQNFSNPNRLTTCSSNEESSSTTQNINSKLRAALQKQPVNGSHATLYSSPNSAKSSAKDGDISVVHQILGEYRQTITKFPELEHVPAQRKRSSNNKNPSKRQRKSKKETPSANSTMAFTETPYGEEGRYQPKVSVAHSSTNSSFANPAPVNQVSGMQMPQSVSSSHYVQTSQPTISAPSSVMQQLPPYSASDNSSQNYSAAYANNGPTISVNGYPENIISQTHFYPNNVHSNVTSLDPNVMRCAVTSNVSLINGGGNAVQNSLYATPSYAIDSQQSSTIEMPVVSSVNLINSSNGCGVDNGYKMYDYSQSTTYETRDTVIASPSDGYKNVMPMNSQDTNSTTMLGNMNDDLKIPFTYTTVNGEVTSTNDSSSVCLSIPEEQYPESYLGNYLSLLEGNNSLLPPTDNMYLKTAVTSSNGQNVQLISTTQVLKPNGDSFDNNMHFVGDFFYPFPQ